MTKNQVVPVTNVSDKPFKLLLETTLNGLRTNAHYAEQATYLLSMPELLELVKSFQPQDSIELLLILQFLIGYLWSTDRLCHHKTSCIISICHKNAGFPWLRYPELTFDESSHSG